MCGIFGLIGKSDLELGEHIAQCLHHRGHPAKFLRMRGATEWSLLLNQPANAVHSAGQMIRRTPLEFISSPANPDYDYLLEHDVGINTFDFGGCWQCTGDYRQPGSHRARC